MINLSGDEDQLDDDLNNISIHESILDYDSESVKDREGDDAEKIAETAADKEDQVSETKEDKRNEKKREKKKKKKGLHAVSIGTVASIPNFSNIKSKVNSRPNKDYRPSEGR